MEPNIIEAIPIAQALFKNQRAIFRYHNQGNLIPILEGIRAECEGTFEVETWRVGWEAILRICKAKAVPAAQGPCPLRCLNLETGQCIPGCS